MTPALAADAHERGRPTLAKPAPVGHAEGAANAQRGGQAGERGKVGEAEGALVLLASLWKIGTSASAGKQAYDTTYARACARIHTGEHAWPGAHGTLARASAKACASAHTHTRAHRGTHTHPHTQARAHTQTQRITN